MTVMLNAKFLQICSNEETNFHFSVNYSFKDFIIILINAFCTVDDS